MFPGNLQDAQHISLFLVYLHLFYDIHRSWPEWTLLLISLFIAAANCLSLTSSLPLSLSLCLTLSHTCLADHEDGQNNIKQTIHHHFWRGKLTGYIAHTRTHTHTYAEHMLQLLVDVLLSVCVQGGGGGRTNGKLAWKTTLLWKFNHIRISHNTSSSLCVRRGCVWTALKTASRILLCLSCKCVCVCAWEGARGVR